MSRFLATISFLLLSGTVQAQSIYSVGSKFNSFRQNTVSVMAASGDTLWIGPSLDFNIANSIDWFQPEGIDSIHAGGGRVFSVSTDGDRIAAGLGKNIKLNDSDIPSGFGYYLSQDGGLNWQYSPFYFDDEPGSGCNPDAVPYNGSCDIQFTYGGKNYYRIRNTVSQQSPPYSTSVKNNTVFSAAWASGLQRSRDFGQSWEKVILPPMTADSLSPHRENIWESAYKGETVQRYDPRSDFNLLGFGVLIDSQNRVWFGSAGGLNISENAISAPVDSISWRHIYFDNTDDGLLGNWIVSIKENPSDDSIWMTNWVNNAQNGEIYGVVSSSDGGQSFVQHLKGQKINDIGFKDGVVFAAGEKNLFKTQDSGRTWIKIPQIRSNNAFLKSDAEFYSAAATTDRIWIGTSDGIASSDDAGLTWEITRVDFPLSGGNVYLPGAKSVDTFAYPNPFSPDIHNTVRIKFEMKKQGNIHIRLFDFGMNLVKDLGSDNLTPGTHETSWNGLDLSGLQAANGVYFYVIEMPDRTINGKILLVR